MRVRTLFAKIFIWFWFTLTVGPLIILTVTVFAGSQPLGHRWLRMTQEMYAHSAIDFYETGGKPALQQYLQTIQESSRMHAGLLDDQQKDVLGQPLPSHVGAVLARSRQTGHSAYRLGWVWTGATPVSYGQQHFTFVMEVHPMRGFFDGTFTRPMLWRLLLSILVAGIFCLFLARHIVAPIRALQAASLRLAAGDLNSRVMPAITPRDDEIADTAKAFDLMADRIQGLIQKRQELLADISHELRSPLTRLGVSMELLRRNEGGVLDQMQRDLDQMNEMIGQILLLTRVDMQNAKPARGRIPIAAMLESIARDANFEGQAKNKTVAVRIGADCFVWGDPTLLRSCVENVVRNAVHYTAAQTVVEVSVQSIASGNDRTHCVITILDHGNGVPAASLPYLFDPFYRVSTSRDRKEGGSGLGLSISQKIVHMHEGWIIAENRKDTSGLCVHIYLPIEA